MKMQMQGGLGGMAVAYWQTGRSLATSTESGGAGPTPCCETRLTSYNVCYTKLLRPETSQKAVRVMSSSGVK